MNKKKENTLSLVKGLFLLLSVQFCLLQATSYLPSFPGGRSLLGTAIRDLSAGSSKYPGAPLGFLPPTSPNFTEWDQSKLWVWGEADLLAKSCSIKKEFAN